MALISVTRLHLRSLRFLPAFVYYTWATSRQIRAWSGFIRGRFATEFPYGFWTMTVWEEIGAMHRFRDAGPHHVAMRKLLEWCDEASYTHWDSPGTEVPTVSEAHARISREGRLSKVHHPSAAHRAGRTAGSRAPVPGPPIQPIPSTRRNEAAS